MKLRDRLMALRDPLQNAEALLTAADESALVRHKGDLSFDTLEIWRSQTIASRHSTMEALFDWSRERKFTDHGGGRERSATALERWLTESLAVWLGLFFNGTPRPNLWQDIVDHVDREGGSSNRGYTMKQYGDVYRIERRRWVEREYRGITYDGHPDYRKLNGIVTVLRHPILLMKDEEYRIDGVGLDQLRAAGLPVDEPYHRWLSSESLPDLILGKSDQDLETLLACVAERLARLYSAFQMFSYSRKGYQLLALWLSESDRPEPDRSRWDAIHRSAIQYVAIVPAVHDGGRFGVRDTVSELPTCVLSTREGIVRDLGQSLGSPGGRAAFSSRQVTLRAKVLGTIRKHMGNDPKSANFDWSELDRPPQGAATIAT